MTTKGDKKTIIINQDKINFQSAEVKKQINYVRDEAKKVMESTRIDMTKLRSTFEI